jgi:NADPH-dependent 2,4-dienoyl-CoA reductase/sulfur reductase-like enzyme
VSPDLTSHPEHALRRVAVVGAGLAGLRTAASLREAGFRGEITVLGAEGLPPYDRPPLSKELFTRPEPAWLADEFGVDLYAVADRVELASPAHRLAPADKGGGAVLGLAGGEEVAADVVVVACGAHAWSPPGFDGALLLHTAPDAAVLRARLTPGTRLVCIGAGWIGSELSGVAATAGVHVTVLEAAEAPLSRQLGPHVGALTVPWFAESGVDLHLGARVTVVRPDGVGLADGRWIPADVVLAAVGARPSTAWLEGVLPLSPRGAVAVDRAGRVAARGFAAGSLRAVGDCADRFTARDGLVRGGHWASALHDPSLVATDMLGGPLPAADPARYTFSTQHGHSIALFGQPAPGQRAVLRGDPRDGEWGALYVEHREGLRPTEAVLTAGLAVDAPRAVAALRRMLGARALPVIEGRRPASGRSAGSR